MKWKCLVFHQKCHPIPNCLSHLTVILADFVLVFVLQLLRSCSEDIFEWPEHHKIQLPIDRHQNFKDEIFEIWPKRRGGLLFRHFVDIFDRSDRAVKRRVISFPARPFFHGRIGKSCSQNYLKISCSWKCSDYSINDYCVVSQFVHNYISMFIYIYESFAVLALRADDKKMDKLCVSIHTKT